MDQVQLIELLLLAARLVAAVFFPTARAEILKNLAFLPGRVKRAALIFLRAFEGREAPVQLFAARGAAALDG